MADYHPLIARAVAGLDKNTGDARRGLYERARTALVAQLRGVVPPVSRGRDIALPLGITPQRMSQIGLQDDDDN